MTSHNKVTRDQPVRRIRAPESTKPRESIHSVGRVRSTKLLVWDRHHEATFENSAVPMYIHDLETLAFLKVNDAAVRSYGYTREEFFAMTVKDIRPPEFVPPLPESVNTPAVHMIHRGLRRHLKKSGEPVDVEVLLQDVLLDNRRVRLVIPIDVTERNRALELLRRREQELRESNEFLSKVIESSRDCIKVLDLSGRLLMMSAGGQRLMEVDDVTSLLDKSYLDFWSGAERELARNALTAARAGGTSNFEGYCPTMKGAPKWWDEIVTPILDAEGKPEKLLVVSRDITERKHADKSLRDSQQWLELAVESSGLALWDSNLMTGEVRRQPHWEELLGCLPGETPGSVDIWRSRVHPEDWPQVKAARDEHLRGSTPYYVSEHRLRIKSGAWIWILDRGKVVERDAAGKPLRMIGGCEDITAQKHAEENRIAQLVHQRDALVKEVHHRIKNHLQGIAGLLRNKIGDHPATERLIEEAITQLQSVGAVYGLQSKPAEGGVPLCRVVEAVCASVESLSSGSVERRFSVAGTGALWLAETEAVPVAVALNELVFNAIKHCATRDGERSIEVALMERNNDAEVRIVNRGRLSANFDYVRGVGTGTGLELVKTLLSPRGSKLAFDVRGDTVEASLRLRPPLVATRTAKAVA